MKKHLALLLFILLAGLQLFGQQNTVPQGMKFQAVARNSRGELLANRPVNLQISLLSTGGATAKTFYTENQNAATNQLGLFELTVGQGKKVAGDFAFVPWATEEIWIEFKIDEQGIDDYQTISTTRLLAVPYAFHAQTAGEITGGTVAGDPNSPEACAAGSATGTLWSTNSNCNTSATAKIGTADFRNFKFVTNGIERELIKPDGKVFFREDVTMEKDLAIDDQMTVGRLHITGENDGPGGKFEDFSLQMDGSSQGAAIKLDGDVSGDGVFLACFDDGGLKGSISGQTQDELYNSAEYILQHTHYSLQTVVLAADIAGLLAEEVALVAEALVALVITLLLGISAGVLAGLAAAAVGVVAQGAGVTVAAADLAAEWIEFGIIQDQSVDGIVLNSGNADYAEWLERADPSFVFFPGQVVGVKGGKISHETKDADHVMAISTAPVVLGNMPAKGRENAFEKVAFMGQVPVRVVGEARIGDFVLASGNADGYAIAVSPKNMKLEDYDRVVGVAWEASTSSVSSLINVGIDMNTNDMSDQIANQARKVARLEAQMAEVQAFLNGKTKTAPKKNPTAASAAVVPEAEISKANSLPTLGYSEEMLQKNGPAIEASMKKMLEKYRQQGLDIETLPAEARAILENPVQALRDVEAGKYNRTFTEQLFKNQAARKAATRAGK